MSYHDTNCPCGGKKGTDIMLCDDCLTTFADHPSMKVFNDPSFGLDARRQAAIILITLARKRRLKPARVNRQS